MTTAEAIIILITLAAGAVRCFLRGMPRLLMEPSAASVQLGYAETFRRAARRSEVLHLAATANAIATYAFA